MILTGPEIERRVGEGSIVIDPFDPSLINPNSYNYKLGAILRESTPPKTKSGTENARAWVEHRIPGDGFVLMPKRYYLANTMEMIGSREFVPILIGRSSIGRLGMFLQISADLGHLGAVHKWTLEIVVVQPLRVYSGMRIGQVSFWRPSGDIAPYSGYFGTHSHPASTPLDTTFDDSDWT
ncbi:hypothetical protein LUZ63_021158 [Rhynchospora breviuscula]|uniref:dCTP deaminase n=1 Tax=Rhynchospora breviuscula TaxID=2022672 RepID=A0A9P9Z836_9POAL|nr:hypothetical protein LUZ63_021158 [Rhynchospora breviuscula]